MDAMSSLRISAGRTRAFAALLPRLLLVLCVALTVPACDGRQAPAPISPAPTSPGPANTAPATPTAVNPTAAAGTDIHAVFTQKSGTIRVRLATSEAPRLCMSFILLAERGYFNGRRWHDFSPVVRQLGDSPPVFTVPREFSPKLLFDKGGLLCASNTSDDAKARAKPNRIFLTVKEQDRWNLQYVVFGTIESGLQVAQALADGEPVDRIAIEGDTAALRARYAKDIPEWSKAIDAALPRVNSQ